MCAKKKKQISPPKWLGLSKDPPKKKKADLTFKMAGTVERSPPTTHPQDGWDCRKALPPPAPVEGPRQSALPSPLPASLKWRSSANPPARVGTHFQFLLCIWNSQVVDVCSLIRLTIKEARTFPGL